MGDRAMTRIKTSSGELYFYTHWSGYNLPQAAREALKQAKPRIGDDAYALKIAIDTLIKETGARDKETGAGILFAPVAEDEYNKNAPSVVLDLVAGTVEVFGDHKNEAA